MCPPEPPENRRASQPSYLKETNNQGVDNSIYSDIMINDAIDKLEGKNEPKR